MAKLSVALVWHMHQPLYKDRLTGQYLMPWVRLHAVKDYLDMATILEAYPGLKQTINVVPSLLEQLLDYGHQKAHDRAMELTLTPVREYGLDDLRYLFDRFFDLNWDHMLAPHPRYLELANKRNSLLATKDKDKAVREFTAQEWIDLTVWFNLAWFDPAWQESDPDIKRLIERGRDFTHKDRVLVIDKQREYIRRIVPTYRRLVESGQLELTTTPYYHPILPLLIDSHSARVARPELPLPQGRFMRPEDARAHVKKGLDYFERQFGFRPAGMWPSEQSVSPAVVPLAAQEGIRWMISDEGVLGHSLGQRMARDGYQQLLDPSVLYQPYWAEIDGERVAMVFRDIVLSDLIGFQYAKRTGEDAANDLISRLKGAHERLGDEPHLITIALDGENCWEHYYRDGAEFLQAFYQKVAADPDLEMVTVSEYLATNPPRRTLPDLHAGSWIFSDFTTWIGEPTKNRAWDFLYQARETLAAREPLGLPGWSQALEEIYIAEGSDWFWWFGEGHDSGQDELFDFQFRLHLQNVYRLLELPVPDALEYPLTRPAPQAPSLPIVTIHPPLDGSLQSGTEWAGAGVYDPLAAQGAMHAAATGIRRIRYGFSERELMVRVEFADSFQPMPGDAIALYICYPGQPRINSPINFKQWHAEGVTSRYLFGHEVRYEWPGDRATISFAGETFTWIPIDLAAHATFDETLDLAIPFRALSVVQGQELQLVVALAREGKLAEVLPAAHALAVRAPRGLAALRVH